jgi:hypothetical protein
VSVTGRSRLIASALLMVMVPATVAEAQSENIPDAMKPIAAATRIFALENHFNGDLGVFDEDEGHIEGTGAHPQEYKVNHAPGQKCTFTMRRRDGPIVESISFDRLSGEYRTSKRDSYTLLVVAGKPGAVCEYDGSSKKCSNDLEMLLLDNGMAPHELDLAARALRYIFSNVCKPAELPF